MAAEGKLPGEYTHVNIDLVWYLMLMGDMLNFDNSQKRVINICPLLL